MTGPSGVAIAERSWGNLVLCRRIAAGETGAGRFFEAADFGGEGRGGDFDCARRGILCSCLFDFRDESGADD